MNHSTSERTLRTAAALGIDSAAGDNAHAERVDSLSLAAHKLSAVLAPGSVALITGPSGAGKTTLLRLLARRGRSVTVRPGPLTRRQERTPVAALSARTPLTKWAGLLARFGLAEARVLISRAGDLSAGERARLQLALAAAKCERLRQGCHQARLGGGETGAAGAGPPVTLIIDEWCSVLDRPTAASIAASAARWARERRGRVRLIGATAHDDLAAAMVADVTVRLDDMGGVRWTIYEWSKAG